MKCSKWQIILRPSNNFARALIYENYSLWFKIFQEFRDYSYIHIKNKVSDFDKYICKHEENDTNGNNLINVNDDSDFLKEENNNSCINFDNDYAWIDYGYMNDINNPFEVY
ncbi:hypothetical protein Ava_B0301 (plasmid) [Trichormus variabilis ATCC 29413]|uniref:Uncharacterized protein n=2 Tax=Anabaena variabilis TaxID=264691 RepID=Q3M1X4_TRIV2|nr:MULTISPECIES: hypothetical protein [Nostocaceae]ABA25012.1 hypothetical protein Ava_B0301 [Trichormus variabilis ATCC 29413]MBC1217838.1 hypothetical protein [Trichormus variabilis ARAD]MBC1270702.1 hypothetical protein [Trichormus variabilis FSR]MBC1305768.1 hypothetical protein [Trichormus variabilis N2B]MBC1330020.1 hypothetical protein [Trichormus variabilis 9RC]